MSHSGYIYSELSQPTPLNRLITKESVLGAAKESDKTESEYLQYIQSEMSFKFIDIIPMIFNQGRWWYTPQGNIEFYIFRKIR